MYISEHVARIRHRPNNGRMEYISKLSRSSLHFFFSFFSTASEREREREYIQNNTQRVNRRANSFVGSFVSLFLTFIVVYNRQKIRRSLSLFFVDYILIYIKKKST
jgi:hypothetical protein